MALKFKSTGTTKLSVSGETLTITQPNLASFKVLPNNILVNKNYIYCDSFIFRKDSYIPVLSAYFKGNGSATINLNTKSHTVSGITAGSVTYCDYVAALVKVLKLTGVSATHYWSACKSLVTDSAILTSEQNACLNGTNFDKTKYSLTKKAPSVVKNLTAITSTASTPIGVITTTAPGYTLSQASTTSNVYYAISVKLSWEV